MLAKIVVYLSVRCCYNIDFITFKLSSYLSTIFTSGLYSQTSIPAARFKLIAARARLLRGWLLRAISKHAVDVTLFYCRFLIKVLFKIFYIFQNLFLLSLFVLQFLTCHHHDILKRTWPSYSVLFKVLKAYIIK